MKIILMEYLSIIKKRKFSFFILVFCIFVSVAVEVSVPIFYKDIVNGLSVGFQYSVEQEVMFALLAILILYSVQWTFWRIFGYLIIDFEVGGMKDLSLISYNYLMRQKYVFFQNEFSGGLVKKCGKFVNAFEGFTDWIFFNGFNSFFAIAFAFIVLFLHDNFLGFVFLIWGICFLFFSAIAFLWRAKYDKISSRAESKIGACLSDTFSNIFTVKTAGIEKKENIFFSDVLQNWYNKTFFAWFLLIPIFAVQGILMIGIEIFFLYFMVQKWKTGDLNIGELVLFQSVLLYIFGRIWDFGRSIRNLFNALADAAEMSKVIEIADFEKDEMNSKNHIINNPNIKIDNISFKHKGSDDFLFENFSLNIKKGEKVALVGHSGSGKTTITNLIFRFFSPQEGKILIDGVDIQDMTLESLRSQISLVSQHPEMFHRTIFDNITLGKKSQKKDVFQATLVSESDDFINNLPNKLQTIVGERGVKLSGGEKQRIAIARAFLDNSKIVILDEATSALDSITENKIQRGISKLIKNKTAIVIAHRLSTIMQMDRIVVLDKGKILEQGTHSDLINNNGRYAEMWNHQKGGFLNDE